MLRLVDLVKDYGEVKALDGCGFEVGRGRIMGFLGPNGAGKTTAMRSIFGLVRPDSGTVTWDDQPITPQVRRSFGYMPEERGLYPKMPVGRQLQYLANLYGLDRSQAQRSVSTWLERLGLSDRADSAVEDLSHGNQQRVQLAAALIHDPELLVLDEPFSGLDPLGVDTMMEILREGVSEGKAVLFSSHQLDLVESLCEDVAIISTGKIVLSGRVDELKDRSNFRRLSVRIRPASSTEHHDKYEDNTESGFGSSSKMWWDEIDGILSHQSSDHLHRLVISADTDINSLLASISSSGQIEEFLYTRPSLSDLFRKTVSR